MTGTHLFRISVCFTAIGLIMLAYLPGLSGSLYYDDLANLDGLKHVSDFSSALTFILSGEAGPLGRPIALASFIPHAQSWPENSMSILAVNLGIHLTNGMLLAVLGYLILKQRKLTVSRAFWIAVSAALLWASLPLLASTSLISIQRMTSLSAMFGILGLIGFATGYLIQDRKPLVAVSLQFTALAAGTLLSILTKESGALIPVFALLIDVVLQKNGKHAHWLFRCRRWILVLPLLYLLYYMSPLRIDMFREVPHRGFSSWDRLQGQVVILWEYLRLALMPLPSEYGPFHDYKGFGYTVRTMILAFAAWILLVLVSLLLYLKKNIVWPLFACLWFLAGHLIESTTITLEPYFEHRNYLAVYGLCLMITIGLLSLKGDIKRLGVFALSAYIAINLAALISITSLWGQPLAAAESWAHNHPASARAAIHYAVLEVATAEEEGVDYKGWLQKRQRALIRLDHTIAACPECTQVQLEALNYSCYLTTEEDTQGRYARIMSSLERVKGARAIVDILFRLRDRIIAEQCTPLTAESLLAIVDELIDHPKFRASNIKARLLFVGAALEEDRGNRQERDSKLSQAEKIEPMILPVLQYQVYSAIAEGSFDQARAAVERRMERKPHRVTTPEILQHLLQEIRLAEDTERESNKVIDNPYEPSYEL